MKLCPPQMCHGPEGTKQEGAFQRAGSVWGSPSGAGFSLSLSFNHPFFMIKLQECQKKGGECLARPLRLFWSALIVPPGFSPASKRHWSRCLRLFKGPGRMGRASGPAPGRSVHGPCRVREGRCFLPGQSRWRYFLPPRVQSRSACALAQLEMPSKEMGSSGGRGGGGGGRAALVKDEPERLDLVPNPSTTSRVVFRTRPKEFLPSSSLPNWKEFVSPFPFFPSFPSFLSEDEFLEVPAPTWLQRQS